MLADQLGFPQVKPDLSDVDRKLMEKANPNWFLQRHFLPLQIRDNQVLVAFADPLDQHARQEAARLFGTDLTPLIASKRIIRETIEAYQRHYQTSIGPTIQTEDTSQVIELVNTCWTRSRPRSAIFTSNP